MAVISIEKLFGGWAYANTADVPVEGADDQMSRSDGPINLWRRNFIGHLASGEVFTALTNENTRVNELTINGVIDSNSKVWSILKNGRVVRFDTTGAFADIVNGTFILGTAVTNADFYDIITYRDQNGTEWINWTYNYGSPDSKGDWARIRSDGVLLSFDEDFFSTLTGSGKLTTGVPLKLWQGPDGIIYSTNGRFVASHDPGTSSGNTAAFDLGAGWEAQAGCLYGIYSAIACQTKPSNSSNIYASESRVYLWNGIDPTPDFRFDLEDYKVTTIINDNGILLAFTGGRDNKTRVKALIGNRFITVMEHPSIGDPPKHGSVDKFRGMIHWIRPSSDNVMALNSLSEGRYGLHHVMTASVLGGGGSSMLKNFTGSSLYAGNNPTGSTYEILKIDGNSFNTTPTFRSKLYTLPHDSRITKFIIYFSQFGTGAEITVRLMKDYDMASGANDLLKLNLKHSSLGQIRSYTHHKKIEDINSFYFDIQFLPLISSSTSAIIRKIEIYYEPTNKAS